jgi:hypothetical protein
VGQSDCAAKMLGRCRCGAGPLLGGKVVERCHLSRRHRLAATVAGPFDHHNSASVQARASSQAVSRPPMSMRPWTNTSGIPLRR